MIWKDFEWGRMGCLGDTERPKGQDETSCLGDMERFLMRQDETSCLGDMERF